MANHRTLRHILIIFVLAIALRGAYLVEMRNSPPFELPQIDEEAYDQQAMDKVRGDWLGDKVFYQDPLYPYFLAVIYRIFGHHLLFVRIIQALIGSANCVLIYFLAREVFGVRVGLVAGIIAALYKPSLFEELLILKSSLELITLSGTLLLLLIAWRKRRLPLWLAAGLVFGLGILVRGNYLLFAPVAGLWALGVNWRRSVGFALASAALFAAGLFTLIVPVTVRNYVVARDLVLTTSQAGANFYIANHTGNSTGTLVPPPFVSTIPAFEDQDFKHEAERLSGQQDMKASEVSRFWFHRGLASITENPRLAFFREWSKLRYATSNFEPPDNQSLYFAERFFSWALRLNPLAFGLIFPLAAVGLMFAVKERRPALLLYLFLAVYLASLLLFYVFARSRLPLVTPLTVFAAFGGICWVERRKVLSIGQWTLAGILFAAAAVWAWIPAGTVDLAQPWKNFGTSYAIRGRYEEAEHAYRQALAIDPKLSMGYYGLGFVAKSRGDLRAAEENLRKAIELDADNWQARAELASVLRMQRRLVDAEQQLQAALRLYPYAAIMHIELGRIYAMESHFADSIRAYEQALKLDAGSTEAHFEIGLVYRLTGNRQAAIEHLRTALSLAQDAAIAEKIRQHLHELGD